MFGFRGVMAAWFGLVSCVGPGVVCAAATGAGAAAVASGPILLADETAVPRVRLAWMEGDGTRVEYNLDLEWTSQEDRTVLGRNLEAFVALGGSRLEHGAGHPKGAIVRVGFFKTDRELLMFEDIANGSSVEVQLRNVKFNQPVTPDVSTLLQRLRYRVDDVVACGLTINQTEMFNMVSGSDDMGGSILPEQIRYRSLDSTGTGAQTGGARAAVWLEEDGTISMDAEIPYGLFRHKGDPWALEVPGTFFEPFHFDIEFEVLPRAVAEGEGIAIPPAPARQEEEEEAPTK